MAKKQLISIPEQFLFGGPSIDETISTAMIIAQSITGGSVDDAGLFAVDGYVFEKDVALAAPANRRTILPNLHPFACLWSLLNNKIGR